MILVEILLMTLRILSLTQISQGHSLLHCRYSYVSCFRESVFTLAFCSWRCGLVCRWFEIRIFTCFVSHTCNDSSCSSLWNSHTLFRITFYLYWNLSQVPEFVSHNTSQICTCGIGLLNGEEECVLNVPVALRLFQEFR